MAAVPATARRRRGAATVDYRLDRGAAARKAIALGSAGGVVDVPARPQSASVRAPVVAQQLRNNCESAALQILLATTGVRVDQLRLQRQFRRSGPLDPLETPEGRVWGNPEDGYVGRPEGGGVAGGFGVYQRPVAALAGAYDRSLADLSGRPPSAIYDALRRGRAVMAWIGLSDGPYGQWRGPDGRQVQVNFGEHTVVLAGIRADGALRVVNPLQGTREVWSPDQFELMWERLDRRALAT